ncbi:COP9 signalosome complex subunit 4 [Chionoecetes opilio]|uniref:COP9 signalosome complex subunit 4 n=1 Tax=Chionoecetes opilio TaxID=41210 RepID=A0A8J5CET3_CHIOP|nr:COP9 signalosome complex subunit 4 [Chionoecetes opilio]
MDGYGTVRLRAYESMIRMTLSSLCLQYSVDYKLETYLKIARLYLEDDDPVQGEAYINRASILQIRKKSRILDVTLTCLRLRHTTLTVHLHRLRLSPDPHCPWCMNIPETIEHFLLQCPRFHSHRVMLHSELLALNVTTFDLPTLLAAAGVSPSRQHAIIRLTCAFLRKTGQLPRLW